MEYSLPLQSSCLLYNSKLQQKYNVEAFVTTLHLLAP